MAGALGGWPKQVALRVIDSLLAFPSILVALFASAVLGPGSVGATVGAALALCFFFARVSSSLTLSVAGLDYMAAAKVLGLSRFRVLSRYVLPNISETLFITTAVAIGTSIVTVSSLSFLGLGVQPPQFDWGRMLTEGVQAFYLTPVAALAPAGAIAVTALAFGFTGEALARASNPALWTDRAAVEETPVRPSHAALRGSIPARASEPGRGVAGETLLDVSNLGVTFSAGPVTVAVLRGISFSLRRGERLGVVGESGSGKTTLAMAVADLVPYPGIRSGDVTFAGTAIERLSARKRDRLLATRLAVIFQDPMSSLNPALTIGTQLTEKVRFHLGLRRRDAKDLALRALRDVKMPAPERQLSRYPNELSGGMRQRVMIAMGLMTAPALVIADEPTTALDVTIQAQIMDLLEQVSRDHGIALILISHNLALVNQNCDRVLVMYAGTLVEDLSAAELISSPLHPYTRALVAAVPDLERRREEPLAEIGGQIPDPLHLPQGCPFHPRCPLKVERCAVEAPQLVPVTDSRKVACWVASEALR
jgi:oligopeptide/dipeptide ABC transporter ATP-binding protein